MSLLTTNICDDSEDLKPNKDHKKDFNAQVFVENLLNEGAKIVCDETNMEFNRNEILPPFYDDSLFKRGQKFFYDYLFAMFMAKYLGLLCVLAIPSIRKLLIFTKMSGSKMKSYRRYVATTFHMKIWYDYDFTPGSRLWKSLALVRKMHNSASKSGCKALLGRITQKDMALTQFGFMGFVTARGKFLGIHNPDDKDLKGFIHVWRVIGYLMGIEDRFNICRSSIEETIQITKLLMEKVAFPEIEKKDKDFLELSYYFADGIWNLVPLSHYKPIMCILYNLVQNNPELSKPVYFQLSGWQTKLYRYYCGYGQISKYYWGRIIFNYILLILLLLGKIFPLLACYYFGYQDAIVDLGI